MVLSVRRLAFFYGGTTSMTLRTLAAAACLSLCTATAGLATTVTVAGIDYAISTITGSFEDNETLLRSQVWWGDSSLAFTFAGSLNDSAGLPNFSDFGPFFAFEARRGSSNVYFFNGGVGVDAAGIPVSWNGIVYATATPVSAVPLPAGGLLLLSAFGGIAALKRRKKRTV